MLFDKERVDIVISTFKSRPEDWSPSDCYDDLSGLPKYLEHINGFKFSVSEKYGFCVTKPHQILKNGIVVPASSCHFDTVKNRERLGKVVFKFAQKWKRKPNQGFYKLFVKN